jgi:hypothetical protein
VEERKKPANNKIQSSLGYILGTYFIPHRLSAKKIWLIVKFYSDRKGKNLGKNIGKYEDLLVTEHSVLHIHGIIAIDTT